MRAVNLLPRDDVPKSFEAKRGVVFGAAGGAALVTVGLTALMLSASGSIGERQADCRLTEGRARSAAQGPATPSRTPRTMPRSQRS